MKVFVVLIAVIVLVLPTETRYYSKYPDIDFIEILKTNRLLNAYFKCVMDTGPCTPDGKELKSIIPDALVNGCQKCTEFQKHNTKMMLNYLIENKQDMWQQLKKKYDPTGIFEKTFAEIARKEGIKV